MVGMRSKKKKNKIERKRDEIYSLLSNMFFEKQSLG
jgi:hypothetical protein